MVLENDGYLGSLADVLVFVSEWVWMFAAGEYIAIEKACVSKWVQAQRGFDAVSLHRLEAPAQES